MFYILKRRVQKFVKLIGCILLDILHLFITYYKKKKIHHQNNLIIRYFSNHLVVLWSGVCFEICRLWVLNLLYYQSINHVYNFYLIGHL